MSEDYINYNYKMPVGKSKQTAMKQLLNQLKDERRNMAMNIEWDRCYQAIEYVIQNTYLKMEKEQIEDAHIEGQRVFDKYPHTEWTNNQAEIYYEQTYAK